MALTVPTEAVVVYVTVLAAAVLTDPAAVTVTVEYWKLKSVHRLGSPSRMVRTTVSADCVTVTVAALHDDVDAVLLAAADTLLEAYDEVETEAA